ncbi:DNA-directed RNA polymerase subunit L [Caldivirga maquilingensis]|uniref:DNA-directed RNA polymerase subunit Rpo11 n=1 Tax=Caldivirga maquilingensis (strain ATCC 700844 / DSM 13496 / JCM 10307 / IC-167) TaxID=397948 RepID=A8M9E3_CALMQ|nr:DNA-directed RNA polymerase subunit L [Caldivirga maquilingensis]ABW02362.1 DNA-directed RNA polymerase subunit L [Caldivirga maquilingensis IC-167]
MPRIKVKSIKLSGDYMEVTVEGEDYTVMSPLLTYILQDPEVEFATFDMDHPLLRNITLKLRTKGKDPLKVLEDAVNRILNDIGELEGKLMPQLGVGNVEAEKGQ